MSKTTRRGGFVIYCSTFDFINTIKSCPICGGDVHLHFGEEDEDSFWLWCHCHMCGEHYGSKEWEEMKEFNK